MNYIGSKTKLSSWIKSEILKFCNDDLKNKIFCDIFAGTGAIGRIFKQDVKKIISNDLEYYAFVLNQNYIKNCEILPNLNNLIEKLNKAKPKKGFIYKNYSQNSKRLYFTNYNAQKIDAIRFEINNLKDKISISEYYFLLASLLESSDKVANTASVYGAFLKNFKKSALQDIILKPANFEISQNKNEVFNEDANFLIKQISGDILYLDPPYNARQYGANYHLLNTIAFYDNFIPKGKTGLRNYKKSKYCSKIFVKTELENLIKQAKFKYIFLSYNNEGLLSWQEIREIFSKFGKYDLISKEYNHFKADNTRKNLSNKTEEFLHFLEKFS